MHKKVILITGVPGCGKTELSKHLATLLHPLTRIGFGDLIMEIKQQQQNSIEYTDLRKAPTKLAPKRVIEEARNLLAQRIMQLQIKTNIIVDSHAVITDNYGFRIIPEFVNPMLFDGVILLQPPASIIQRRLVEQPAGRQKINVENIISNQSLQSAVVMAYTISHGIPAYVIDEAKDINELSSLIIEIFNDLELVLEVAN